MQRYVPAFQRKYTKSTDFTQKMRNFGHIAGVNATLIVLPLPHSWRMHTALPVRSDLLSHRSLGSKDPSWISSLQSVVRTPSLLSSLFRFPRLHGGNLLVHTCQFQLLVPVLRALFRSRSLQAGWNMRDTNSRFRFNDTLTT